MPYRAYAKREKLQFAKNMRNSPTEAEAALWEMLRCKRMDGFKFRRQEIILGYIVDFYCPKLRLIIEVDGSSHEGKEEYDAYRQKVLEDKGLRFLRFQNYQVFGRPDWVRKTIRAKIKQIRREHLDPQDEAG